MSFVAQTKDCSALSEAELEEMASLCAGSPADFDLALLTKAAQDWVIVTQVRDETTTKLHAFGFCTLERIGGTPAVLWGLSFVKRSTKRDAAFKVLLRDQYRRALNAFPDEDVLCGTRVISPAGYTVFKGLDDICLRPDHRTTGEERAWSRRLAKRFGCDGRVDDRTFVITGDGSPMGVLDHEMLKEGPEKQYEPFFVDVDRKRGDALVAFGWLMAEALVKMFASPLADD